MYPNINVSLLLDYSLGTSRDWGKGVLEIPFVYTLELRDRGEFAFELPPDQILPTGEETWEGIRQMVYFILTNYYK